jgi:hypothetical protein
VAAASNEMGVGMADMRVFLSGTAAITAAAEEGRYSH